MPIFNSNSFERQGNTENDHHILKTEDICDAIIQLSKTPLRSIKIFTPNLENSLYNNELFRINILNFIRGNRHAQVQILAADLSDALTQSHILLRLAKQATTAIKIKNIPEDHIETNISFILFDQSDFIFKADRSKPGVFQSCCKNRCNKLNNFFTPIWEQAELSPQSQQFHI